MFDAWLLMATGNVSMVDARDAMLAADMVRFGGAHQALLWNTFAHRGLGAGAASPGGGAQFDPIPSFESPHANNATVTLGFAIGSCSAATMKKSLTWSMAMMTMASPRTMSMALRR